MSELKKLIASEEYLQAYKDGIVFGRMQERNAARQAKIKKGRISRGTFAESRFRNESTRANGLERLVCNLCPFVISMYDRQVPKTPHSARWETMHRIIKEHIRKKHTPLAVRGNGAGA
jgi:hypothetical protein